MSRNMHSQKYSIKLKSGPVANINATATINLATIGEPHWTTDGNILYVFNGTNNMAVVNRVPVKVVSTTYQALITDNNLFCDTDGGAFTITLPQGVDGQVVRIVNTGTSANLLTIDGYDTETVKGATTQTLSDGGSMDLVYNTTVGWW